LIPQLEELYKDSRVCVDRMLQNRDVTSTSAYKEIPSVLAKALVLKYQCNNKCKEVKRLSLPISGDKGRQVKIQYGGLRIPAFFKKEVIPVVFPKPIDGYIREVEFFIKKNVWYMSYSYYVKKGKFTPVQLIGVDRNSKENVVAIANPISGEVIRVGPCVSTISYQYRKRRAKLQRRKKWCGLKRLSKKQARRTKDINHKVSHTIVDYAEKTLSAIVLEDLSGVSKSKKIGRKVKKSQWSYSQLEMFIKYKASLLGIPVFYINPAYTSQTCSRCGSINKPNGKHYKCKNCGHVDHRDANAAFNIVQKHSSVHQALGNQKPSVGISGDTLNWSGT
jgi:putative transposase